MRIKEDKTLVVKKHVPKRQEQLQKRKEDEEKKIKEFQSLYDEEVEKELKSINYLKELGCFKSNYIRVSPLCECIPMWYDSMESPMYAWSCAMDEINRLCAHKQETISNEDFNNLILLIGDKLPISYRFKRDWCIYKEGYLHTPTKMFIEVAFTLENKEGE